MIDSITPYELYWHQQQVSAKPDASIVSWPAWVSAIVAMFATEQREMFLETFVPWFARAIATNCLTSLTSYYAALMPQSEIDTQQRSQTQSMNLSSVADWKHSQTKPRTAQLVTEQREIPHGEGCWIWNT